MLSNQQAHYSYVHLLPWRIHLIVSIQGPPGILGLKGEHGKKGDKVPANAQTLTVSIVVHAQLGFQTRLWSFCRVTVD